MIARYFHDAHTCTLVAIEDEPMPGVMCCTRFSTAPAGADIVETVVEEGKRAACEVSDFITDLINQNRKMEADDLIAQIGT